MLLELEHNSSELGGIHIFVFPLIIIYNISSWSRYPGRCSGFFIPLPPPPKWYAIKIIDNNNIVKIDNWISYLLILPGQGTALFKGSYSLQLFLNKTLEWNTIEITSYQTLNHDNRYHRISWVLLYSMGLILILKICTLK